MLLGRFFGEHLVSRKAIIWAFSCSRYLSNPFFMLARKPATFRLQIFRGSSAVRDVGSCLPFVSLKACADFSSVILCSCESQLVICLVLRNFSAIAEIFSDCLKSNSRSCEVGVVFLVSIFPAVVECYPFAAEGWGYRCPFMLSRQQGKVPETLGVVYPDWGKNCSHLNFLTSLFSIKSSVAIG